MTTVTKTVTDDPIILNQNKNPGFVGGGYVPSTVTAKPSMLSNSRPAFGAASSGPKISSGGGGFLARQAASKREPSNEGSRPESGPALSVIPPATASSRESEFKPATATKINSVVPDLDDLEEMPESDAV